MKALLFSLSQSAYIGSPLVPFVGLNVEAARIGGLSDESVLYGSEKFRWLYLTRSSSRDTCFRLAARSAALAEYLERKAQGGGGEVAR